MTMEEISRRVRPDGAGDRCPRTRPPDRPRSGGHLRALAPAGAGTERITNVPVFLHRGRRVVLLSGAGQALRVVETRFHRDARDGDYGDCLKSFADFTTGRA